MIINLLLVLTAICTLAACDKTVKGADVIIKPVSCENSFAITDYDQVWLFDFKLKENEIFESLYLKYPERSSAASQVNYLCQSKELAVGYTYRGKSGSDAGIDFIGEKGVSTVGLNPDRFNNMIPVGPELFVYTALMKRDKIDPNIGAMTLSEYAPKSMHPPGYREITRPSVNSSDHVFIDMLVINLNRHSVDRKFRFPTSFGHPIWVEGDNFILDATPPLAINKQNGFRKIKVDNFNDLADFYQFRVHGHYYNEKFYIIVGKRRSDSTGKIRITADSIYVHNNSSSKWDKIASLNFDPVHVTGFQNEIVIFGRDSFARFDIAKNTVIMEKRNFEGMIAAATAWIKDGRVVVMSHPYPEPDTYGGGEIWVYDSDWKKVIVKRKLETIGLPNITSQLCPFPSSMNNNSL